MSHSTRCSTSKSSCEPTSRNRFLHCEVAVLPAPAGLVPDGIEVVELQNVVVRELEETATTTARTAVEAEHRDARVQRPQERDPVATYRRMAVEPEQH